VQAQRTLRDRRERSSRTPPPRHAGPYGWRSTLLGTARRVAALRYGWGEITLRAQGGNGALELGVADHGEGFAPDFLPLAFDRFSRPDDARSGAGSGLGLSIEQAIAHAHGGDVPA
jgi:hypothetical protein